MKQRQSLSKKWKLCCYMLRGARGGRFLTPWPVLAEHVLDLGSGHWSRTGCASHAALLIAMNDKYFQAFALAYMIGWLLARLPKRK